jgi:hypothetical protein
MSESFEKKFQAPPLSLQSESGDTTDASARFTTLSIHDKRKLVEGGLSTVSLVTAETEGGATGSFVLKEYDGPRAGSRGQEYAEIAFSNYSAAKKRGLRVFPTFRLAEDKKSILMTTGHTSEWLCVSRNYAHDTSVETFGEQLLERIDGMQDLAEKIFQEAVLAARVDIRIYADAYFFLVNMKNKGQIDFVLGDFDHIEPLEEEATKQLIHNLQETKKALVDFILHNLTPDERAPNLETIEKAYAKTADDLGLSEYKI